MPEVIEECQMMIQQYENQLSALDQYQSLVSKFESALYKCQNQKLEIVTLSDALKLYFYQGIPMEKWFLIPEIMKELDSFIDSDLRSDEWFLLLQSFLVVDQSTLKNYLNAFHHFLELNPCEEIASTEISSYIEKYACNELRSYQVSENLALAIIVKHNFRNIFEKDSNFENQITTVDGIYKTFSFLLLYELAYDSIHEQKDYFLALVGVLLLYNHDLKLMNQALKYKQVEIRRSEDGKSNVIVIKKSTPENCRLVEQYRRYIENLLNIEPIYDFLDTFQENQNILGKERKRLRQQQRYLTEITRFYSKEQEFYSICPSISALTDLPLQKKILWGIKKHNRANVSEVQKLVDQYETNDFGSYALILHNYGIDPSDLTKREQEDFISICKEEDLKQMLSCLESTKIAWRPFYYFLFTKSDLSRMQRIEYYIKKKYVTSSFIESHMEYYDLNSSLFSNFETNVQTVLEVGIDPKDIMKKNASLWEEDYRKLSDRVTLYKKYGVDFTKNPQQWYDYLEKDFSFDLLDEWIELGFLGYTRSHVYLLREQNALVGKKIRLIQEMGFQTENGRIRSSCFTDQFLTKEDIIDYFGDEFISVSDEVLSQHSRLHISNRTLSLPIVRDFDSKYLVSDSLYEIDGVCVSRNRFLRNLEVLMEYREIPFSEQVERALVYTPYCGYSEDQLQKLRKNVPKEYQKKIEFPS